MLLAVIHVLHKLIKLRYLHTLYDLSLPPSPSASAAPSLCPPHSPLPLALPYLSLSFSLCLSLSPTSLSPPLLPAPSLQVFTSIFALNGHIRIHGGRSVVQVTYYKHTFTHTCIYMYRINSNNLRLRNLVEPRVTSRLQSFVCLGLGQSVSVL